MYTLARLGLSPLLDDFRMLCLHSPDPFPVARDRTRQCAEPLPREPHVGPESGRTCRAHVAVARPVRGSMPTRPVTRNSGPDPTTTSSPTSSEVFRLRVCAIRARRRRDALRICPNPMHHPVRSLDTLPRFQL